MNTAKMTPATEYYSEHWLLLKPLLLKTKGTFNVLSDAQQH